MKRETPGPQGMSTKHGRQRAQSQGQNCHSEGEETGELPPPSLLIERRQLQGTGAQNFGAAPKMG
jgi:hypothetical protein